MAIRPVFCAKDTAPFYRIADVNFEYFSGFSVVQKQRCIVSLHNSFLKLRPQRKVLEISSKGMVELGVKLSAFNLICWEKLPDKQKKILDCKRVAD